MKKQIDYIMDRFNFAKVHKTMEAVNWIWASTNGVPEECDLRERARELLENVAKLDVGCSISTGGFEAAKYEDEDGAYLSLDFRVEEERAYNE